MAKIKPSTTPTQDAPAKAKCPITKEDFLAHAKPVLLRSEDGSLAVVLTPKEFSTGSFGWGFNDKATLSVNGVPLKCQGTINLTVVHSKPEVK